MGWLQLYKKETFISIFSKTWLVVLGLLAWILVYYWSRYIEFHSIPANKYNIVKILLDRLVASAFCFFLIGSAVIGYTGIMAGFLENRVSVYLGKISYGIYLYHNFIFNHYHSWEWPTHPTVRLLNRIYRNFPELKGSQFFELILISALTIAVASVSWHFFEKPINALKDRYAK